MITYSPEAAKKSKEKKPLYLKDQIRNELLSKGAEAGLSSEDEADDASRLPLSASKLTFAFLLPSTLDIVNVPHSYVLIIHNAI